MRKASVRGWSVDDRHPRGWQNTGEFMAMYPTRPERREYYARRALFYKHVRAGKTPKTAEDLQRYCRGEVK